MGSSFAPAWVALKRPIGSAANPHQKRVGPPPAQVPDAAPALPPELGPFL
jgi:hypothetical protein